MNSLKSFYPVPYISLVFVGLVHSIVGIIGDGFASAWTGSLIATLPAGFFFARLMARRMARTSRYLPSLLIGGAAGTIVTLLLSSGAGKLPVFYALGVGLVGSIVYVFWYSRLPDGSGTTLRVGEPLPDFELPDIHGELVSAANIATAPALLMFFRGNWCPLCMTQIREIAGQYSTLAERGVQLVLISPQPEHATWQLAAKYDVPFRFLVDQGSRVAAALGILHISGVPRGMLGYEADTVLPTIVLTDANGKVVYAQVADNYRVRPEPEVFIGLIDELIGTAA